MVDKGSDFDVITAVEADRLKREEYEDLQNAIAGRDVGRQARFHGGSGNANQTSSEKRRKQRQADIDAFYIALMQDDAFGGFVASEVWDGKSDFEITHIALQIERKSGLSFDDYASKILGADASQRKQGESDADYKRRMIKDITEQIIDPITGQIKAEYADDPLANILREDAIYQRIMEDTAHINLTGQSVENDAIVKHLKDSGYETAELSGDKIENQSYSGILREGQNNFADIALSEQNAIDQNQGFFGSPDKTAEASKAALSEFNGKAAEQATADPIHGVGFDMSMRTHR